MEIAIDKLEDLLLLSPVSSDLIVYSFFSDAWTWNNIKSHEKIPCMVYSLCSLGDFYNRFIHILWLFCVVSIYFFIYIISGLNSKTNTEPDRNFLLFRHINFYQNHNVYTVTSAFFTVTNCLFRHELKNVYLCMLYL